LMATLFNTSLLAQSNTSDEDFFIGKYNLTVKGLADYDLNLILNIKKTEGIIGGEIEIPGFGEAPSELIGIVVNDSIFAGTTIGLGFDMPLILNRKDEKNVTGSLMGIEMEIVRSEPNE